MASTQTQVLAALQVTGTMAVTGSWKLATQLNAWTRVIVHVPDTCATTQQAIYTIHMGDGATENRIINTASAENVIRPFQSLAGGCGRMITCVAALCLPGGHPCLRRAAAAADERPGEGR
ncbi:hypothetical protein ABH940_005092 [Streptacidiphilus sp. BW17]|uniref:hypothetical protein n=1 Tax=Streptacidiphilus sp. BW17 TaxID=3156274 RepID=UPI003513A613